MAITYFERPLNHEVYSLESGLAIVQNGDTASVAITSGQYIFLKNHSTLPNGGYHATTNIASGTTISSSNVAADANGIANGAVSKLNGNLENKANITGTPEIVSNSNGVAYKFPNGLMICTKRWTGSINVNSAWGTLYEPATPANLGNWAVAFTGKPIVSLLNTGSLAGWPGRLIDPTASFIGNFSPIRPTTGSGTWTFDVVGVGRWK